MTKISLSGLHRRTTCCGAEPIHPRPMSARHLKYALLLICPKCQRLADKFEVVNEAGEVIWPVPDGFGKGKREKARKIAACAEYPYVVRLPARVLKTILGEK